ncbi:hypothetical protein POM88_050908 [Heracleum sosnowskyi]|uniref:Aminoacyl-tRNA synthetase class Ia domain-containing protein n=1 Tax=Heracleum sosnowskyi TaxID=360622 RepID=A0AAD8GYG8_9APIA|nr:hypothetical protein POM88_050908 [Heracleum sosnowskyi]
MQMEQEFESKLSVQNKNPPNRSQSFAFRVPQENFSIQDFELGKIYGVGSYSKVCGEQEKIITRTGRWIDFKNDYKTMDLKFMETVCFEANSNFKQVPNPEIMVTFPIADDSDGAAFVAWTPTPWTRKSYDGSSAGKSQSTTDTYEVLDKFSGASLVGTRYVPLFDYFKDFSDVAFKVVADDYVTSDRGSGVVHCAPAFEEDDYRVCLSYQIITKKTTSRAIWKEIVAKKLVVNVPTIIS